MFLERRMVSRKTPGDGKLEISDRAAGRLMEGGAQLVVSLAGKDASADVRSFECGCGKKGQPHTHWFLQSDLLKSLSPDDEVTLDFDAAAGRVDITGFTGDSE
jgi:hypothetical protein